MATDFAVALRRFLTSYLAGLRGCSPSTIASYRDTFKLLISWFRDERSIPPGKLTLDHIDADAVTAFLGWLQDSRHNSVSTRNQRLAAISSFCTWMQTEDPARMACWQDIIAIPVKKQDRPAVRHLTVGQTRLLLAQPDRSTRQGRRDATLLATLYDTGARVSELAKHRLDQPGHDDHPVFYGQHRARLSRGGIAWIIRKYQAQTRDPLLAGASISPHILRHSKAMHLYEAGVPLPCIRDILGHVDLSTTEIYARASTEAKRKALEAAYQGIVTSDLPEWNQDAGLLDWLTNL